MHTLSIEGVDPHKITRPSRMRSIRCWLPVLLLLQRGLRACVLDTVMSPAKTAEPIEVPFGLWTLVLDKKTCFDWNADLPRKGHFWGNMTLGHVCGRYT